VAHLAIVAFGAVAYPYLYDALAAVAYGFLLPGIAVLHVRHAAARQSGAILGTIAGAAVATVGLAGSANVDVRPASLFVLGLWWWTIGKMWSQPLEACSPAFVSAMPRSLADALAQPYFSAAHLALGLWLIALGWTFATLRAEPAA